MSLTTWFLRKLFEKNDNKRDAGLETPADVSRRDNIAYGPDKRWQLLDVYRPKDAPGPLPVIVSIHGGGWTYGDKDRYQYYCMDLARRGFAVVNFTYRLAPEHKFPAGIEDTCAAFAWVAQHPAGFDLNRLFAVGDSAGAHMLAIYCALCGDGAYARRLGVRVPLGPEGKPFLPRAVGLNCGIYQINLRDGSASQMTRGLMKALLPEKGSEEELALVNPLPWLNGSFPRAFIMTANRDPLAGPPAQKALAQRLAELNVPFVDRTYGDDAMPLDHVFHCDVRSSAARLCNDDECCFFLSAQPGAQGRP